MGPTGGDLPPDQEVAGAFSRYGACRAHGVADTEVQDPRSIDEPDAGAVPPDEESPGLRRRPVSGREGLAIAVALLGGGTVTFALMTGAGSGRTPAARPGPPDVERPAAALPDSAISRPRWQAANDNWLSDARRGAAFEVYADNKVPVWQRKAHPILIVRCEAGEIEAFVFIETAAKIERQDGRHTVVLGFDGDPEQIERWPDSADHDALFAPDGAAFAQRLARATTLRFGYTPHHAAPVVATFSVAGLPDMLKPAARHCGASGRARGGRTSRAGAE